MKQKKIALFLVLALLVVAPAAMSVPSASAQSQTAAITEVEGAFNAVWAAEHAGANVTDLDRQLNQALNLTSEGVLVQTSNPSRAHQLFSQAEAIAAQVFSQAVTSEAQVERGSNESVATNKQILLGGELSGLGITALLAYLYLPSLYWGLWTRLNRDSKVSRT
jgi:hypothetical protein